MSFWIWATTWANNPPSAATSDSIWLSPARQDSHARDPSGSFGSPQQRDWSGPSTGSRIVSGTAVHSSRPLIFSIAPRNCSVRSAWRDSYCCR